MKIYTKKGDRGETFLFGGGPFPKDDERIEAYGTVDELNSVLGCAITQISDVSLAQILRSIQEQLFTLGAELSTLAPNEAMRKNFLKSTHIELLEKQIDEWEKSLAPLKNFVLPGGSKAAGWLHLARTVCRRAERLVVKVSHEIEVRPDVITYLNRLSDWFFVLARYVNYNEGVQDILWAGILK